MKSLNPRTSVILVMILAAIPLFVGGCGVAPYKSVGGRQAAQTRVVSKEELRKALNEFEAFAISTIKQSADQTDRSNSSVGRQKIRFLARVRLVQAFETMLQQDDPFVALVETWCLSHRVTRFFEQGQGGMMFGSDQPLVIAAAKGVESRIEQIGHRFLEDKPFSETKSLVEKFSNQNPINGSYTNLVVYAVEIIPGEASPFSRIIDIPMAPFRAVEGVDRTASSIYGVRSSMDRFTDVVEDLPDAARWQMLLLLMDMENVDTIQEFLASMSSLSESSEKMLQMLDDYPQKIRQQASVLISEIDAKQAAVQTTLAKAGEMAAAMEKTTVQIQGTMTTAQNMIHDINQTAAAWKDAADATSGALGIIKGWTDAPRQGPSTFKITDYRDVAVETTRAAGEIRAALSEVDGKITAAIDHILWRIVQVIVLVFVLMVVYRFAVVRGWEKIER